MHGEGEGLLSSELWVSTPLGDGSPQDKHGETKFMLEVLCLHAQKGHSLLSRTLGGGSRQLLNLSGPTWAARGAAQRLPGPLIKLIDLWQQTASSP